MEALADPWWFIYVDILNISLAVLGALCLVLHPFVPQYFQPAAAVIRRPEAFVLLGVLMLWSKVTDKFIFAVLFNCSPALSQ